MSVGSDNHINHTMQFRRLSSLFTSTTIYIQADAVFKVYDFQIILWVDPIKRKFVILFRHSVFRTRAIIMWPGKPECSLDHILQNFAF